MKYEGFRPLADIEYGRCRLVSRNGNAFATYQDRAQRIGKLFPRERLMLDREIVCLDETGRPQFKALLFRRGDPIFVAFDLLHQTGKDLRLEQLLDRKAALRRVLNQIHRNEPMMYADDIKEKGEELFLRVRPRSRGDRRQAQKRPVHGGPEKQVRNK
jgi:ATP-dependent DNA ligase